MGLDLSLTATGIACAEHVDVLKPPKGCVGMARLDWYRQEILMHLFDTVTDTNTIVIIEGYSYNSRQGGEHLGELGGVIRYALWKWDLSYIEVAPAALKKFATGKGNCGKDQMIAAAARLGCPADDNNAVDAWWLRQMGLYASDSGPSKRSQATVPDTAYRDEAAANIDWPEFGTAA
jgi:Holliday junction resolvasome RuvABC endonuclease subunit